MDSKQRIKILELSFDVMENFLTTKKFNSKEELIELIKKAVELTEKDEKLPEEIKLAYAEAYHKIDMLSWEEILEIKQIISE